MFPPRHALRLIPEVVDLTGARAIDVPIPQDTDILLHDGTYRWSRRIFVSDLNGFILTLALCTVRNVGRSS